MTRARALRPLALVLALLGGLCALFVAVWNHLPPTAWVDPGRFVHPPGSRRVTDRRGRDLRVVREGGVDRRWVPLGEVSPSLIDAVIAAEDARFYRHEGVDARALARAAALRLVPFGPRSGASTITQQLVKLVYGRPAGALSKPLEVLRAAALERVFSKEEILEQYLNRLPFGDRIEGVARASEAYFGHGVSHMTAAEAALLAGIPQGPSVTEPRRHLERAMRRRATVLGRMRSAGMLSEPSYAEAMREPPSLSLSPPHPYEAARFVDRALASLRDPGAAAPGPELRTTLDLALEKACERTLSSALARLRPRGAENAAAVVIDNRSGEILAYVGAARSGPDAPGGELDLLERRRQPGSTLKPFVYELLFEKGATAGTVLDDVALPMAGARGSLFEAHDYDGKERGPVTARVALASSLNLAALDAAARVGQEALVGRLSRLGLSGLGSASHHGAAAVLGGVDVSPLELARSYVALARGGTLVPLATTLGSRPEPRAVMAPGSAAVTTHVLSDPQARAQAFGSDLTQLAPGLAFAVKTGTSQGFRDAWTAAYTDLVTVVVWMGHPDGTPMAGVSGFEAAAPAAVQILSAAHRTAQGLDQGPAPRPEARLVPAEICPYSGLRAGPLCPHVVKEYFLEGTQPTHDCLDHDDDGAFRVRPRLADWAMRARPPGISQRLREPGEGEPLVIREPRDRSRLLLDPARGETRIRLRARAGGIDTADVTWEVDGQRLASDTWSAAPGEHTLLARRGKTVSPKVKVKVLMP